MQPQSTATHDSHSSIVFPAQTMNRNHRFPSVGAAVPAASLAQAVSARTDGVTAFASEFTSLKPGINQCGDEHQTRRQQFGGREQKASETSLPHHRPVGVSRAQGAATPHQARDARTEVL